MPAKVPRSTPTCVPLGLAFAVCLLPAAAQASGHLGGPLDDKAAIAVGAAALILRMTTGWVGGSATVSPRAI